jgi:flagellar FliL protein
MAENEESETQAVDAGEKPAPKAARRGNPWLAVIAVVILSPLVSICATQFFIIPQIKGAVADRQVAETAKKAAPDKGQKTDGKPQFSYEFQSVVVNLAGTMGTRYLKVTFTVFSDNQDLQKLMADNKAQLLDVATGVLSARSLADLELAGAKNTVRNDLVANFNQALNGNFISQIYFSEFVVQ